MFTEQASKYLVQIMCLLRSVIPLFLAGLYLMYIIFDILSIHIKLKYGQNQAVCIYSTDCDKITAMFQRTCDWVVH